MNIIIIGAMNALLVFWPLESKFHVAYEPKSSFDFNVEK